MAGVDWCRRPVPGDRLRTAGLGRHIPEVLRHELCRPARGISVLGPERTVSAMAAGDEFPEVQRLRQRERDHFWSSVADTRCHRRGSTRLPRRRRRWFGSPLARGGASRPASSYVLHTSPNHVHSVLACHGFRPTRSNGCRSSSHASCNGSGRHAGHAEHAIARLLQPQARAAASRHRRVPECEAFATGQRTFRR